MQLGPDGGGDGQRKPDLALDHNPETNVAEALDALVGDASPIGLAVSGGGDSMALLHLTAAWATCRSAGASRPWTTRLRAFTVDHGLRDEAAAEAAQVARLCASMGLSHQTLHWRGGRGVQADARRARHALMAEALREHGGRYLLTGHTADDQLETFLMRARQGSGWYGLGGMDALSVSPVWPEGRDILLARPLLAMDRASLRAWLGARGHHWTDDPSNTNRQYERVRVRDLLAASPQLRARVGAAMAPLTSLRRLERRRMAAVLSDEVEAIGAGQLVWRRGAGRAPSDTDRRVLGLLIQVAAGHADPIDQRALGRLVEAMQPACPMAARTLGGAWIAWDGSTATLSRDPGGASPQPGRSVWLWDGRFERTGAASAGSGEGQTHGEGKPIGEPVPRVLKPVMPQTSGIWRDLTAGRLQITSACLGR